MYIRIKMYYYNPTEANNRSEIIMTTSKSTKNRNSKLQVTLNQWKEIYRKEMAYSEDLRKQNKLTEATLMISKIQGMMA
jgi:hypothetical protein